MRRSSVQMGQDPLFHDERQYGRMARDPQILPRMLRLQWFKLATGIAALALIAAIWLTWRVG
jgi:hypothetical protein